MVRRVLAFLVAAEFLFVAVAPFVTPTQAAGCGWGNIAVGCNGDCVQLAFTPACGQCPHTTVDVQRQSCGGGGSWSTIATNVTSPVSVSCDQAGNGWEYRLVANCCGGPVYSQSTGCITCP